MSAMPFLPARNRLTPFATVLLVGLLVAGAGAPVTFAADRTAPVVTAPMAKLRSGTVTASSVPVKVAWSASDPSGIASYRLQEQVDGGSWQKVHLASATARKATVRARPGHDYAFRVRAVDRAGNVSSWAAGETVHVRRMSEQTPALATSGPWKRISGPDLLGGHALRSRAAGATATFKFTGNGVAWFATRAPSRGAATVYLDGTLVRTVHLHRSSRAARRMVFRWAWPTSGSHTLTIRVVGTARHPAVDIDGFVVLEPPGDPVLVGAGDISYCSTTGDSRTAALLDRIGGRVFVAGDLAYPDGTKAQFRDCYGPTWGRWKLRTSPVPGNHEYHTAGAAPYFAYFGSRAGVAGKGWYAYDLGSWRIYNLNANCDQVGCGPGSAQVRWLETDLAEHPRQCVAAVWHQPLFSSGMHGNNAVVRPLWAALEAAGAEVVLNGHDHDYERFAPQTAWGAAAPDGIREFVVGTGGGPLRPFASIQPNSVVRRASTFGVLKLTLREGGYGWSFIPVAGATFTDSGSGTCH
jgi:Calcineurin-like phosphoesterase